MRLQLATDVLPPPRPRRPFQSPSSDSKVGDTIPDLKDIFSSAMDSIEEEHDDSVINKVLKRGPGGFGGAGNGGFNGGFDSGNNGGMHNRQPRA